MFFTTALLSAAAALLSVTSLPVRRDVDTSLVPAFGVTAGTNPDGSGNCDGVNNAQGVPIKIPCSCPPDLNTFLSDLNSNVAAGHVLNNPSVTLSFPSDNSTDSQFARINACLVTLQNLNGAGVGCPASSTDWVSIQSAILAEGLSSAPASSVVPVTPAAPASAAATSAAASSAAASSVAPIASSVVAVATSVSATASAPAPSATVASNVTANPSLVPQFGITAGQNPDGTGNCDGVNNAQGVPVKIPCACPPDRDSFIAEMSANVAAGHVLNNPTVLLTFPLDDSESSQLARLNAAAVTLQNLQGPGVGCPIAATTFSAQQQAILDGSC